MEKHRSQVLVGDKRWLLGLSWEEGAVGAVPGPMAEGQRVLSVRVGQGGRANTEHDKPRGDHQVHSPTFVCKPSFPFLVWAAKASL